MAEKWRTDLASWAIPDEILSQVTTPPWIHPVAMFTATETIPDSKSHQIARAAVPIGGSVLDIGSGGGRAAFALVVCHHVAFNVPDIVPFLQALNSHAVKKVVLEIPFQHPLTHLNPLWKKFWDLDRPTEPTAEDLFAIAKALGFDARLEIWVDETWGKRVAMPEADRIKFARIRLCLSEDQDAEVAAALIQQGDDQPRQVATLWWDVSA